MSRSGHDDEGCYNDWALIRYRGQVASALPAKRAMRRTYGTLLPTLTRRIFFVVGHANDNDRYEDDGA